MSHFSIRTSLVAGLLAGAAVLSGCHGGSRPVTAGPPPSAAPTSAQPVGTPVGSTKPATTITGTFLYHSLDESGEGNDRLVRLRDSRVVTVLKGDGVYAAELSPDGKRIAYIEMPEVGAEAGNLMVANSDGTGARKLRSDAVGLGFGPSWSPDSTTLVIAVLKKLQTYTRGTIRVADKKFTPLPRSLQDDIRYRFSGDGRQYFYQDGECRVLHANVDGTDIRRVPVLGDLNSSTNPRQRRACDLISVNHDGSRATVSLVVGDGTNGDIGGTQIANAVIDTATGKVLSVPVRGQILQALYQTDGRLLVLSERSGKRTLTLLSADDQVLATMAEPASVKGLKLHDYAG